MRDGNPTVGPKGSALPDGLYYCRFCGEIAGQHDGISSTCLCEGIACRWCGIGKIRRPISDHFAPAAGGFRHVAYFGGWSPCRQCVINAYGRVPTGPYSWPGPLEHDPSLRRDLKRIKRAGLALSRPIMAFPGSPYDPASAEPGLYALYGDASSWSDLGLEKPPHERPLYVGETGDRVPAQLAGRSDLQLAAWQCSGGGLYWLKQELRSRWHPPFWPKR